MKKTIFLALLAAFSLQLHAQDSQQNTEQVWRINILNPGVEYEFPTGNNSTFSANIGVGFTGGSYPNLDGNVTVAEKILTSDTSGLVYLISPFVDLQEKWFYNLGKRQRKGKSIANNSGNFISARFLVRGKAIDSNFGRSSNIDFALSPTWGIQRNYGHFHLLFDMGTQFYFDDKGNSGWFPFTFQLNLGFDL